VSASRISAGMICGTTRASWHVQHGTPLYDLQEMGGWKSEKMVRRYAHLAPANLAKHAQVVGELLEGTNLAQPTNEKRALLDVTPCVVWFPNQGKVGTDQSRSWLIRASARLLFPFLARRSVRQRKEEGRTIDPLSRQTRPENEASISW
jgi:hypothetical protein